MSAAAPERAGGLRRKLGQVFEVVATDVLVRDVTNAAPRKPASPLDLRIERVRCDMDWRSVVPADRRRTVRPFLERRRDTGFLAFDGDTFCGWIWVSRRTHRDPWSGLHIRLAPDEAYAYALWVEPEYRPKGVARYLMATMLEALVADPHVTRVYGWVDQPNRESHVLLRLLGFKGVQSVRRAQLLSFRGVAVPRTCRPAVGPLARNGRHRDWEAAVAA